jgi:coenzyme F420-reducing hydrogenase alpha subunit
MNMKTKTTTKKSPTKTIKVNYLARVEGEGGLYVKVKDHQLKDVKLKIFEPPRFFEAFLRDRDFREAPDITARICGICPIAYLLGASQAMEDVCGVKVTGPIRDLRRLIYCGEWIESHVLHIYMLHAPDFLGYPDAIQLAKDYPEIVQRGLKMKKVGNDIMALLGGREIHPINLRVGGFYKVPTRHELETLTENLKWGLEAALATVQWVATLPFPKFEQDYEFVALRHPDEYAITEGRLVSNQGIDVPISEYDHWLIEEQVPHSTALQIHVKGRGACLLGPLARYSLNFDKLSPLAQEAARDAGLGPICRNPFQSIIVRSVETLYAFEEALRLIKTYEPPAKPAFEVQPRAGTGYGCTEAPRGICYHRYRIDDHGTIHDAKIVSPTAVNQKTIESDLWHYIPPNLKLSDEKLQWQCEQAIRNYDPCISCSTHFLKLEMDRE